MSVIERPTVNPDVLHGDRVVLRRVTWDFYSRFLNEVGDRSGIKLTYNRGNLEIMSPTIHHEAFKSRITRLIETLCRVLQIRYLCIGSATIRREDIERGLEPDAAFYIRNLPLLADFAKIDFSRDPAPDLGVEIDVTSSSLGRFDVYSALRVLEIWRFDGSAFHVHLLGGDGHYSTSGDSGLFPGLPFNTLADYVHLFGTIDDLELIERFEEWVRATYVPIWNLRNK